MGGFEVSYIGALFAGVLSFLSPCVLPLVPPYLCFLGGVTLDQIANDKEIHVGLVRRVFISALFFVFGFSTIFIALGATASTVGNFIAEYMDLLSKIAGITIIILGAHFVGFYRKSLDLLVLYTLLCVLNSLYLFLIRLYVFRIQFGCFNAFSLCSIQFYWICEALLRFVANM